MQKTIHKILSCLLALVMVLGLFPVSALATEEAAVSVYQDGVLQASYADLQSAVDQANGGVVVLEKNITENITVNGDLYLDLNGKTLTGTVSGEGMLCGMDSANDTYDASKCGRITGSVSCGSSSAIAMPQKFSIIISAANIRAILFMFSTSLRVYFTTGMEFCHKLRGNIIL